MKPRGAIAEATVALYGVGFDTTPANNTVRIGGTEAEVQSATERVLTVTVPASAPVGAQPVSVTVDGNTRTAPVSFDVLVPGRGAQFAPSTTTDVTTGADGASSVYATDVDGDGDTDVLSASRNDDTIAWYENDGGADPSFTAQTITTGADGAYSVYATDVDGDGDTDVLSASFSDATIAWYENDGGTDPSFTAQTIPTRANGARSVYATDVDGDGDTDVLSASTLDSTIAWYENDGGADPSFTVQTITTSAVGAYSVYATDVDGDGDTDVLSASQLDDTIAWHENDGGADPSFTAQTITTGADGAASVYATDVDGDGDIDVLSASAGSILEDSKIAWYENDGGANPSFTNRTITTDANEAFSVYAMDVDGDGDTDVLSASQLDDTIAWYENDGRANPSFTNRTITTDADGAYSVYATDMDGDGDTDVLSASSSDNTIAWYSNRGPSTPPRVPSLAGQTDVGSVSLSWQAATGPAADAVGTTGYNVFRAQSAFSDTSSATRVNSSPITEAAFDENNLSGGQDYVYRVQSLSASGAGGALSPSIQVRVPPQTISASPTVSFGDGDATDAPNYRLAALPGNVSQSVEATLSGSPGEDGDWRAFEEAGGGSGGSSLNECSVDVSCTFGPGTGVWILSRNAWSPSVQPDGVGLTESDAAYEVPVHNGWNVISNPFDVDVEWSRVQAATGGGVGPLYTYTGTWSTTGTMASATDGRGYYFNNDAGLSTLVVPYPGARATNSIEEQRATVREAVATDSAWSAREQVVANAPRLYIEAIRRDRVQSHVTLTLPRDTSTVAFDRMDVEAPPSPFHNVVLRSVATARDTAYHLLEEYRPRTEDGQRFDLHLRAPGDQSVTLRIDGMDNVAYPSARLVERSTGRVHNLKSEMRIVVHPHQNRESARRLVLLVGKEAFVERETAKVLPDDVILQQNYPNPVSGRTTIEFTLPREQSLQLEVYDILGRRVRVLASGSHDAGFHQVEFSGGRLASGVYFYRLRTEKSVETRKMIVVR